jgi:hypothetical protein
MKLALYKFFLGLLARDEEFDDDRGDIDYVRMAKKENVSYEPLRDVLAEIEDERHRNQIRSRAASARKERAAESR